jgi:hypothetical protein
MEKDVLKNPLTNRNAASAQLLYGQVTATFLMGCAGFSHFGVSLVLATFDFSVRFRHFGVSLVFSTFDFSVRFRHFGVSLVFSTFDFSFPGT